MRLSELFKKIRRVASPFAISIWLAACFSALSGEPENAPVTLSDDGPTFTLNNGIVSAKIDKRSGTIAGLRYAGQELLLNGYWSQVGRVTGGGDIARYGSKRSSSVKLDPASNGGARAEVACKFEYDKQSGGLPCDVELCYALERGGHGLYMYAIWEHKAGQPGFSVGEARAAFKFNPKLFDFLGIDSRRLRVLPSGADWDRGEALNIKEARRMTTGIHKGEPEHKYDYSAILADTPAYGWASSEKQIGLWLINPSIEYLAGGPTKVELTGHLDVNSGGHPTLLNMWHGSHYGGSVLNVSDDEAWSKIVGPFMLYCNSGSAPEKLWREAQDAALKERAAWPYAWVSERLYPPAAERGCVSGKIELKDPQAPPDREGKLAQLQVGLAFEAYGSNSQRGGGLVDWQRDSKHYQFWTRADESGNFKIQNVRPGNYTLYAFADGVLGEFSRANISVKAGDKLELGTLSWTPVRYGKQVWEIGIPNRSAEEFKHGDDYWHWGLYNGYAKEFPNDVNFTIGRSDYKKDWNYAQPPRLNADGRGQPSTWTINFDIPETLHGKATLRIAIAGSRLRNGLDAALNDKSIGTISDLPDTGVMHRDGIRGYWVERKITFDASLLLKGANTIKLRTGATNWVQGILYDYLRLEVAE